MDNIIRSVYYDADSGFGSISETYKQAHHTLNTFTVNVVKGCSRRQKSRQSKSYRGFNSYVAN